MIQRKYEILRQIIKEFICSAHPVSSAHFTKLKKFNVSSATIRNEMSELEKEGFITQPHTSAGRIPTIKGYQHFVENMMEISKQEEKEIFEKFQETKKKYFLAKAREKVYDGISIFSQMTQNIAFATIPENKETIYLGIANLLKQPEFSNDNSMASSVIEVLESGFFEKLEKIEIGNDVDIHIGEKDIFPQFESCALMCTCYDYKGFKGVLGVVGPIRLNYARNKLLIQYTKMFIEGQKLLN